jgi:hypothetical protein
MNVLQGDFALKLPESLHSSVSTKTFHDKLDHGMQSSFCIWSQAAPGNVRYMQFGLPQ